MVVTAGERKVLRLGNDEDDDDTCGLDGRACEGGMVGIYEPRVDG